MQFTVCTMLTVEIVAIVCRYFQCKYTPIDTQPTIPNGLQNRSVPKIKFSSVTTHQIDFRKIVDISAQNFGHETAFLKTPSIAVEIHTTDIHQKGIACPSHAKNPPVSLGVNVEITEDSSLTDLVEENNFCGSYRLVNGPESAVSTVPG